jgi:GMP synthase-like glutamine amidotransferase
MKPIRIFQHEDWIQPGRVAEYFDARGIAWELVAIDRGDPVPQSLDDVSALVFLGGTMSVNDGLPWAEQELALIGRAGERKLPMLGHCLGSQLIAKGLGAKVAPMAAKEIGWHRVTKHDNAEANEVLGAAPGQFDLLIWHHDAFTLPPGASPLYSSPYCANQAYVVGNAMATVAHPEVTAAMLAEWLRIYGYDIEPNGGSVQSSVQIADNIGQRCATMHREFTDRLYDAWMKRVEAYNRA